MMNTITLEQLYDTDEIGVRTYNVLRRGGFECLNELINKAVVDLIKIRNMSKNSMMQIAKAIAKYFSITKLIDELSTYMTDYDMLEAIEQIESTNDKVNNKKVKLLLNLAKNSGATYGEKVNSINLCKSILGIA